MGYDPCLFAWRRPTAAERRAKQIESLRRQAEHREAVKKAEARRRAKWDRIRADFARARTAAA